MTTGRRWKDPQGYIRLYGKAFHKRGWALEHRWVMQQILGRELLTSEHVHHRNGVKDDNRPENLVVVRPGAHTRHHNNLQWPNRSAGRWAEQWDQCTQCGESDRQHAAGGRCFRCYDREYQKARRAADGAVPKEVREKAWSVSRDGTVYYACRDCARDDVRPGARGLCQACVRWRKHHGDEPRTKPPRPFGSRHP